MATRGKRFSRRSLLQSAIIGAGSAASLAASRRTHAQTTGDVDKAIAWAKANLPNSTPDIVRGAAKEGKLTLLLLQSGSETNVAAMISKFKEHYPFLDVGFTMQVTTQILNRFNAELNAKRGVSDFVHLPADLKATNSYIESGAIAKFVISQDAAFPESAKRSGLWYAWSRERTVTAYRKGALSDEEKQLVRTFKGLGDPRFKGRLGINGVTNSVSVTGSYVLLNQPDKSIWDGLVANKPKVKPASAGLLDGLLSGEYDIAVFSAFGPTASISQTGAPIEFGNSSPSPILYIPGGISALAPNPNAARLWQDWAMSKEAQDLWTTRVGTFSARSDTVPPWAKQQPFFFEDQSPDKPLDWVDFTAKQPEVVARFKNDFQTS